MAVFQAHPLGKADLDATTAQLPAPPVVDEGILSMLLRLRELALILRRRRMKRGALELVSAPGLGSTFRLRLRPFDGGTAVVGRLCRVL